MGHYKCTSFEDLVENFNKEGVFQKLSGESIWMGQLNLAKHDSDGNLIEDEPDTKELPPNTPNSFFAYDALNWLKAEGHFNIKIITFDQLIKSCDLVEEKIDPTFTWRDRVTGFERVVFHYLGFIYRCFMGENHNLPEKRQFYFHKELPPEDEFDFKTTFTERELELYNRQEWRDFSFYDDSAISPYYHALKGHWILQDFLKNGPRSPVCASIGKSIHGPGIDISFHPGSVRSQVIVETQTNDWHFIVTDPDNCFYEIPYSTPEELISCLKSYRTENIPNNTLDTVSFSYADHRIEFSMQELQINPRYKSFRGDVFEWSRKMNRLFSNKNLKLYIGHDDSHYDVNVNLSTVCETSVKASLQNHLQKGQMEILNPVEIKKLDNSKIPEYTRPYQNQSTSFTYSRFLIPFLENFEGFSLFVDDDFIFIKNPLKLFYYVDPDMAVTCVQYPDMMFEETKFDNQKNVNYPKKLWSSLMIFNNNHPDCKKLTPEIINSKSGSWLHQFEWTDKIGKIPERYIYTEGYSSKKENEDFLNRKRTDRVAIHYTRGGPWIENMDCENISNLELYKLHRSNSKKD